MMHRWQGRCLLFHSLLTGGTDMQHARRIAQATGGQRHLDALLLDRRRLPGVALHQQEGPSTPLTARPAPLAGLALRRQGMLDDIAPWAIGAGQHWHNHRCSLSPGWGCAAQTRRQDRRATALKHLPLGLRADLPYSTTDSQTAHKPLTLRHSAGIANEISRLNHSTRDSYTRYRGHVDIACIRVQPVYECCVARFSIAKVRTHYSLASAYARLRRLIL